MYSVKTLSPSEATDSDKSSGYITTFVNNEYATGSKKTDTSNGETQETTASGNVLQETIDLSKQLSLGILSLTIASLQGSTGQELLSAAEQEFNAIVEQALNATITQENNSTGSNTTGVNTIATTSTTPTPTPTTTTSTTNTATKTTTTKSSLSAQDKEEAEAFLELFQ